MSGAEFERAVQAHADCGVVVSLPGVPGATRRLMKDMQQGHGPKVVAFAQEMRNLDPFLEKDLLHSAIVLRESAMGPDSRASPEARFEREYEILRAAETDDIQINDR